MNKPLPSKPLAHLLQPLTIGAVLVLLLNDHWLRQSWPSWITGKLGDLAWLYFMPFVLAACLDWILPGSLTDRNKIIGYLSFGTVAAIFLMGNSFPVCHQFLTDVLARTLGFPVQLTRDPSDLLALISCFGAWQVWERRQVTSSGSRPAALAMISAGALLTLANVAVPDRGILCLDAADSRISASAPYQGTYISSDGGFTWVAGEQAALSTCDLPVSGGDSVADPAHPEQLYRMNADREFEYSLDNGNSWLRQPRVEFLSEAELAALRRWIGASAWYNPGPFQALRDPVSGNLLFAMGLEGVLVNTPEGKWTLVPVGVYGPQRLTPVMVPGLLSGEIVLALELALLIFCTLDLLRYQTGFGIVITILLWSGWGFVALGLRPALNTGYGLILQNIILAGVAILALVDAGLILWRSSQSGYSRSALRLLKMSSLAAVAFLLPYLFWAANLIPSYYLSMAVGFAYSGIALLVVWRRYGFRDQPAPAPGQEDE